MERSEERLSLGINADFTICSINVREGEKWSNLIETPPYVHHHMLFVASDKGTMTVISKYPQLAKQDIASYGNLGPKIADSINGLLGFKDNKLKAFSYIFASGRADIIKEDARGYSRAGIEVFCSPLTISATMSKMDKSIFAIASVRPYKFPYDVDDILNNCPDVKINPERGKELQWKDGTLINHTANLFIYILKLDPRKYTGTDKK